MDRRIVTAGVLLSLVAVAALAEDRVRIVNEGGIRDQWMLADGVKLAAPGYPAAFAERGDSVCVAIGYAIQPDGTTSDFALLKNWNSSSGEKEPADGYWDAFTQAGAGALAQWKFKPRPEVTEPKATYTVATMHFMGKTAVDAGALRGHCAIADLAVLIERNNKRDADLARERNKLDRAENAARASQSMIATPGLRK